jgi:hypothetical protein
MIKVVAGLWGTILCGFLFVPLSASAANDIDKAALKKATAECRAQVKQYAQYHESSWYARHKMVKKCIADPKHVCRQCY